MPRAARKKSEEAMYHVMSRSISEIDLFQCDEDKDFYLTLLKKYKEKYHCKIYCYVLMDNHVHILSQFSNNKDAARQKYNMLDVCNFC